MLSLIFSNKGDLDSLRLLNFTARQNDVELIIIDSLWEKQKGEQFRDLIPLFKQVVYAPPKPREHTMRYDLLSCHNTGLAYSEELWCMPIGGKNELVPFFFTRLRETIDNFGSAVAIRPVELEANNGDVKWDTYVKYPQRYFILPFPPLGYYGLRSVLPIITCGFIIMPRKIWYDLNGLNEEYDVGCKWWDNELLDRLYASKTNVIVDQQLLLYRYPHISMSPPEYGEECKQIYELHKKFHAETDLWHHNDFRLPELHESLMQEKQEYIL